MNIEIEFYILMAAISLSLSALASLISLFRGGESYNEGDILIFRAIILGCFFLLFGCIIPVLLAQIEGLSPQQQTSVLSLIFSAGLLYLVAADIRRIQGGQLVIIHRFFSVIMVGGSVIFIAGGIANAFIFEFSYFYAMGLTWGTFVLCIRLYLLFIAATRNILEEAKSRSHDNLPV